MIDQDTATRAGLVSHGELPVPYKVHKQEIVNRDKKWAMKVEQLEAEISLLGEDLRRAEKQRLEARLQVYELRQHTLMKVRAQLTRARKFLRRCTPHPDDERAVKRLLKARRP